MFVQSHFEAFEASIDQFLANRGSWAGFSAQSLANYIVKHDPTLPIDPSSQSNKTLTRADLYSRTLDLSKSNLDFIIDVLSWGGVNRRYAAKALSSNYRKEIIDIVGLMRSKLLTSTEAYERFYELRKQKKMPGIGPAYYTKLIFFAHPEHSGFIMDQWTARSINLLTGKQLVKTIKYQNSELVHDDNSPTVYAEFCETIRKLTLEVEKLDDPKLVEEALFSGGGKNPFEWRKYVKMST